MKRNTRITAWTLFFLLGAISALTPNRLDACTGITLKSKTGDVVYGRTMEWGTFDIYSRIVIYPRNQRYEAGLDHGRKGLQWTGRYGVAGIDGLHKGYVLDGINEKGLSAGLFYHPGFSSYVDYTPENANRAIAPTDVLTYLLSTCATAEDARKAFSEAVVVNSIEEAIGIAAPVHVLLTEPDGTQLVIEWVGKGVQFYESKLGVFTNAPEYPWHLTNLRNYVNLSLAAKPTITLGDLTFAPLGGGSGMLGLPGDFTPPSRFIRAAAFCSTARPLANAEETLYEAFRILDNFNVPLGAAEGEGALATKGLRSSTAWTIAHDHTNLRFLYHTQNDRRLQMIDLKKIDFAKLAKAVYLPIDDGKQTVLDRTGEVASK